ncbi:NAD(P)-dependent alcohol dehydrogenase [Amycolatopsis sp. NPDC051061]|uniref:zinc-dependent alcohol dehydrogenase family protein n=1 Tax=Amycolatopsis sp. NPDC051061 TaxID=3155042 RepID=UPI003416AD8D
MKRWILPAGATTADQLRCEDAPAPEPGPRQVRIRVNALSINARDRMILAGPFGRTPGRDLVPLSDVAGVIDALGNAVQGWSIGDRVMTAHVPGWPDGPAPTFGPGAGSFDDDGVAAEQIVVDATALVATPASLSDAEASTLQVAGVTAWNSLFGWHPIQAGQRILVLGSGGVAVFAAQLATAAGAHVTAAVRANTDDPRWARIGVADVITTAPGWGRRFFESAQGADKVVDAVGPGMVPESLAALRGSGEVTIPGLLDLTNPGLDFMEMIARQASIRGVAVGSAGMHRDLAAFVQERGIHPVIERSVAFADLPEAYRGHVTAGVFGKTVIVVDRR